ncbi:polyprenyl synthetase family protein [Buchnera aphidicola]|uniref:(2E,6E)-farnesyl diphosphate synthase n=1 Tax=Buchnera aphidicola subsp. Melaphis rhois TaxID=118103 RepID=A0A4D6Y1Q4_BUCMH|nr:polyprenyl synthetase family protein [Buchnera aphidicola]QCI23426.1 (2E,6E)-farnesyl diphosphate synthase [Buchnera aphidicola (Melaphis rhois)]
MDLLKFFSIKQNRINNFMFALLETLPFQDTLLVDAMKYGVLLGGKRIRPVLMYIIGKMFQVNLNVVDVLASSIEFMHAYSLIHDDLPSLDNDILRRGQDSCHIKFGESTAILAGNSLQCLAFNILSRLDKFKISNARKIKIILELSSSAGVHGMCAGQFFDLSLKNTSVKPFELEQMYLYKTGSLINSSVRLVVISSKIFKKKFLFSLEQYVKNISLAFQIQDDILDFIDDKNCKNTSVHYSNCSKTHTFPLMFGLQESQRKLKILYKNSLAYLKNLSNESIDIRLLEKLAYYIITRVK